MVGHPGIPSAGGFEREEGPGLLAAVFTGGMCGVHLEPRVTERTGRRGLGVVTISGSLVGFLLHMVSWF